MSYFKYDKFFELLKKKNISVTKMIRTGVISNNTYMKMKNNTGEGVTTLSICKICDYLNCKPNQIMEFIKEEPNDKN